jgi:hypothetical protein
MQMPRAFVTRTLLPTCVYALPNRTLPLVSFATPTPPLDPSRVRLNPTLPLVSFATPTPPLEPSRVRLNPTLPLVSSATPTPPLEPSRVRLNPTLPLVSFATPTLLLEQTLVLNFQNTARPNCVRKITAPTAALDTMPVPLQLKQPLASKAVCFILSSLH